MPLLTSLNDVQPGWHQVAFVQTEQAGVWYVDGTRLPQTASRYREDIAVVGNAHLGANAGAGIGLDNLQIFSCALSQAEVFSLYQASSLSSPPQPAATTQGHLSRSSVRLEKSKSSVDLEPPLLFQTVHTETDGQETERKPANQPLLFCGANYGKACEQNTVLAEGNLCDGGEDPSLCEAVDCCMGLLCDTHHITQGRCQQAGGTDLRIFDGTKGCWGEWCEDKDCCVDVEEATRRKLQDQAEEQQQEQGEELAEEAEENTTEGEEGKEKSKDEQGHEGKEKSKDEGKEKSKDEGKEKSQDEGKEKSKDEGKEKSQDQQSREGKEKSQDQQSHEGGEDTEMMGDKDLACVIGESWSVTGKVPCRSCSQCLMQPLRVQACSPSGDTVCKPEPCSHKLCREEQGEVCLRKPVDPFFTCQSLIRASSAVELVTQIKLQVPLRVSEPATTSPLPQKQNLPHWEGEVEACLEASLSHYSYNTASQTSSGVSRRARTKQEARSELLNLAKVVVVSVEETDASGASRGLILQLEVHSLDKAHHRSQGGDDLRSLGAAQLEEQIRKRFEGTLALAAVLNSVIHYGSSSCTLFAGAEVLSVEDALVTRCEDGAVLPYPQDCTPAKIQTIATGRESGGFDSYAFHVQAQDHGEAAQNSQAKRTDPDLEDVPVSTWVAAGVLVGGTLFFSIVLYKKCKTRRRKVHTGELTEGELEKESPALAEGAAQPWSTGDRRGKAQARRSPAKNSKTWSGRLKSKIKDRLSKQSSPITPDSEARGQTDSPLALSSKEVPSPADFESHRPDTDGSGSQQAGAGVSFSAGGLPVPVRCGRPREPTSSPALISRTPDAPLAPSLGVLAKQPQIPPPTPSAFPPSNGKSGKKKKGNSQYPDEPSSGALVPKTSSQGKKSSRAWGSSLTRSWRRVNLGEEGSQRPRLAQGAGMLPPETPPTPVPLAITPSDLAEDSPKSPESQSQTVKGGQSTPRQGDDEEELIRRLHFTPDADGNRLTPSPSERPVISPITSKLGLNEVPLMSYIGGEGDGSGDSDES
eukprot:gb/GEZN01000629.1/.p1 GENE.gb/GEZN01000629.1/~~gb/GEZN01000629.1/.p1  ORF type:complete len:1195 (+),score=211.46 gb/GEZN01000629.1/:479-3586(+)